MFTFQPFRSERALGWLITRARSTSCFSTKEASWYCMFHGHERTGL